MRFRAEAMAEKSGRGGESGVRMSMTSHDFVVRWTVIDRALADYGCQSLIALLAAALDSPACRLWERQLVLLWTRAVRRPPHGAVDAKASDLVGLVEQAVRAAPGRAPLGDPPMADARDVVRHEVAGRRLRIHPGDHGRPQ